MMNCEDTQGHTWNLEFGVGGSCAEDPPEAGKRRGGGGREGVLCPDCGASFAQGSGPETSSAKSESDLGSRIYVAACSRFEILEPRSDPMTLSWEKSIYKQAAEKSAETLGRKNSSKGTKR